MPTEFKVLNWLGSLTTYQGEKAEGDAEQCSIRVGPGYHECPQGSTLTLIVSTVCE